MIFLSKRLSKTLIFTLLLFTLVTVPVMAEEDGYSDGFNDPELPGWEHTPETIVSDGVLRIGPGNFAVHTGNIFSFSVEYDVRYSGNGIIFFRYNMGEERDYACLFFPERVVIEKVFEGEPQELASADWNGFSGDWDSVKLIFNGIQHELFINDDKIVTVKEDGEPHASGSMGFFVEGDASADFDNFSVIPVEGTEPAAEAIIVEEESTLIEPTVQPTSQSAIEALLTQISANRGNPLELTTSAINLLLSVVFAFVLSRVYIHWGSALSNRRRFAANFILITVTTTFIILIVRSSVALSLGLVGALSIVRFRAAIKEPEELAYLFFAIGIGIGLGDNQRLITILALSIIILVIAISRILRGRGTDFNLHLTIASSNPGKLDLELINDTLKKHTMQSRLMRTDENKQSLEASFLVEFKNSAQFIAARNALQTLSKDIEITFLDNKGIG